MGEDEAGAWLRRLDQQRRNRAHTFDVELELTRLGGQNRKSRYWLGQLVARPMQPENTIIDAIA